MSEDHVFLVLSLIFTAEGSRVLHVVRLAVMAISMCHPPRQRRREDSVVQHGVVTVSLCDLATECRRGSLDTGYTLKGQMGCTLADFR